MFENSLVMMFLFLKKIDGSQCTCYDICINPSFYDKILQKPTFMGFLMSIVIEGLEEKYSVSLDRSNKSLSFIQKLLI